MEYVVVSQEFDVVRCNYDSPSSTEVKAASLTGALYKHMKITPTKMAKEGIPSWTNSIEYLDAAEQRCEKDEAKAIVVRTEEFNLIIAETIEMASLIYLSIALDRL